MTIGASIVTGPSSLFEIRAVHKWRHAPGVGVQTFVTMFDDGGGGGEQMWRNKKNCEDTGSTELRYPYNKEMEDFGFLTIKSNYDSRDFDTLFVNRNFLPYPFLIQ